MKLSMKKVHGDESIVAVKQVEMRDPTFGDGELHSATVTFSNPKAAPITYEAELYLGSAIGDRQATSGVKSFSIAAGKQLAVEFPLAMPAITVEQKSFKVILPVSVAGTLVITYVATEDVIVRLVPAIDIIGITWV